ncbi:hypothetical protein [Alkalispirillum mobile]|nr:hypothetical protein [Alkalispirillum mobile]
MTYTDAVESTVMPDEYLSMRFLEYALKRALRKPAPNPIPRSGEAGAAVDGYVVYLRAEHGDLHVLVDEFDGRVVQGRALHEGTFELQTSIPTYNLRHFVPEIQHYYGLWNFNYSSALRFIVRDLLHFPVFVVAFDVIQQALFNRKRLVRNERITLLRDLVEHTIKNPQFKISHIGVMSEIYTNRWVHHPSKSGVLEYYKLALDSLAQSGDLKSDGSCYSVSPKALETLAQYEEQERKHRDNVKQKRALNWLTFVLVLLAALQVYGVLSSNGA